MAGPTEGDVRVRRSKVRRQEERRERQTKARRVGGAQKQEKADAGENYIVVRESDAAESKYLTPPDADQVRGVALEQAKALAEPVAAQEAAGIVYAPVRVGAWRMAVASDGAMTAAQAEELYEKTLAAGDEE